MSMLVRAFPLTGSIPEFDAFVAELRDARKAEADAFYAAYGIAHESCARA
ncbi:MAG TPA: hypothetical protein VED01_01650 [Burkholderiales bacterium]|nr:hypothetical protein [Burkholderiales bacterium]